MSNTIRIKRRSSAGASGAPSSLENAELAFNEADDTLYYGKGTGGAGGSATSVIAIGGPGHFATKSELPVFETNTANIKMNGTVAVGTATTVARADHVHASDTTKANVNSPTFTGTPAAPTASVDTNTTQLATTAYVVGQASSTAPLALNASAVTGTSLRYARADHRHIMPRLDEVQQPTADVNLNSRKITNLATPTASSDAATKGYVDSAIEGLKIKDSARVATTANITLSGTQTIDGVAVAVDNRVLVKNQNTASQNGLYLVKSGAWVRTDDMDVWSEVPGAFVIVEQGTTQADTSWLSTADQGGTLGTTAINFIQFQSAGDIIAGNGLTRSGNTLSVVSANTGRLTVSASGVDLATTAVSAGTYRSVTVDTYGRVTAGTNPTTLAGYGITDALSNSTTSTQNGYFGDVFLRDDTNPSNYMGITCANDLTANRTFSINPNNADRTLSMSGNLTVSAAATVSGTNTGDQTITLTGDVTGSGTGSFAATLANSGVTAGTYNNVATQVRPFTVDAKGRVTSIGTAVTVTPAWSSITSTPTTLAGYGITDAVQGNSAITGATHTKITYDSKGLVTAGANLAAADIPNLDTSKITTGTFAAARMPAFTGDATSTAGTVALTLANSGVTAGTYNNVANQVRPFTVDAKGRVTSIGTAVTIAPNWSNIASIPATVTSLAGLGPSDTGKLDFLIMNSIGSLNIVSANSVGVGVVGATTADEARLAIGATTVGGNLFTLTNPSAVRFLRINADNTVSALSNTDFRTAIGAGTGNGTVTSVAFSGGTTGLTVTGSPITGSGTITLSGTLAVANGGTGATTAANARTNLGLGTIATQAANNVTITGGTISNVTLQSCTIDGGTF